MTVKEAVSQLKDLMRDRESFFNNNGDDDIFRTDAKACDIAIEALEKQIPKKPIISEEQHIRYVTTFECPACNGKFTGFGVAKYCYRCGQALDWSEINA